MGDASKSQSQDEMGEGRGGGGSESTINKFECDCWEEDTEVELHILISQQFLKVRCSR